MRKLLTNDSNEADHRDEDAIAGVLIPLDNLEMQNYGFIVSVALGIFKN